MGTTLVVIKKRDGGDFAVTTDTWTYIDSPSGLISRIQDLFDITFPQPALAPPAPTYRVGQRFRHVSGWEYILAVAGNVDNAVLVNLKTGCNFSGSKYARDYDAITAAEFAQICAGTPSDFMLIEGEI